MEIEIGLIEIKRRKRKLDNAKVAELAGSINEIGLLNPVTVRRVNGHFELVAGAHRLEAFKLLGRDVIPAEVFDGSDLDAELAEIDENLKRAELTVLEQGELLERRNEILTERGERRMVGRYPESNGETVSPLKSTPDIALEIGLSERGAQQRMQIARDIAPDVKDAIRNTPLADSTTQLLALARMDKETQSAIAKKIAEGEAETVTDARRLINKSNVKTPAPIAGKYRIFYADPPWEYGNSGSGIDQYGPAERHYPVMTIDELCAMGEKVVGAAENDSVLFLWTTSPMLEVAFDVINAWGFKYKTSFVWDKVKHNFGHYNSVRHELLLVCTRGSCTPDCDEKIDSVQSIERSTRHSEKPEEFRAIIEKLYPQGGRLELFRRGEAPKNWCVWGNEC